MESNRISRQLKDYLEYKHSLGFKLTHEATVLKRFAAYTQSINYDGPLTTEIVLKWVASGKQSDKTMGRKIEVIRPFSKYVYSFDREGEIIHSLIFKNVHERPTQYQEVLKKYPLLSELCALTKDFYSVIFSKNPAKMDDWINTAQKYDIPELQTFLNGVKKDLTAVKNGIIYPYNNGLAEGSVNKIKVIKRIMYGRNSFELLKAKVLFSELL